MIGIEFYVEQQKEAICSRNTSQEKEAERRVAAEKSEDCNFVQKGVQIIGIAHYTFFC